MALTILQKPLLVALNHLLFRQLSVMLVVIPVITTASKNKTVDRYSSSRICQGDICLDHMTCGAGYMTATLTPLVPLLQVGPNRCWPARMTACAASAWTPWSTACCWSVVTWLPAPNAASAWASVPSAGSTWCGLCMSSRPSCTPPCWHLPASW